MEAEIQTLKQPTKMEPMNRRLFDKLKPHIELIAALISGALIMIGWVFATNEWPSVIFFISAYVIGGFAKAKEGIEDTLATKELNVELLMILAAIGSAIIGYWTEGAILIFIFALSGALETYTMNKSSRELSALMALQPEEAWIVCNGEEHKVAVNKLQVGDHILVKPGERIPTDGNIIDGMTTIDESAITGESVPVSKTNGHEVFAGTVNMRGTITLEMTKPSDETLFQKIIALVQSAQSEKSPSQQFIERFEGPYVKIVLGTVAVMMVLPVYVLGWSWTETFYRAMVLLVVASPCALVASVMPATLSAISSGARNGMLFKGGAHLENLSKLRAIAFDKTGTLTSGKPVVTDIIVRPGLTEEELLLHAASLENYSNHPLATAIVQHASTQNIGTLTKPMNMEDIAGYGVQGSINGTVWKVGKAEFVGQDEALAFQDGIAEQLAVEGKTIVYVRDEEGIAGIITLKDTLRTQTKEAIKTLKAAGVHTIMLTGDNEKTAAAIAEESGVDTYIAECLPETKVDQLKQLIDRYEHVGMVGDGINDAPALATATVGIAMGEGTDVALETADVVLMKNELPKIANAVHMSRKMNRIIKQNVVFSIAVIALLIVSNFMQSLALPLGVLGHEGSTILVILNGLRMLKS